MQTKPPRRAVTAGTPLLHAFLVSAFALTLAGCGDRSVTPKARVPLALRAQGIGGNTVPARPPLLAATMLGTPADDIDEHFTRAVLALRRVRLKRDVAS